MEGWLWRTGSGDRQVFVGRFLECRQRILAQYVQEPTGDVGWEIVVGGAHQRFAGKNIAWLSRHCPNYKASERTACSPVLSPPDCNRCHLLLGFNRKPQGGMPYFLATSQRVPCNSKINPRQHIYARSSDRNELPLRPYSFRSD